MKSPLSARVAVASLFLIAASGLAAQNLAIVNGKPVPSSRMDYMIRLVQESGQPITDELKGRIKEEVIQNEVFVQEAEKRGLAATPEFAARLDTTRQALLIRALIEDQQKALPVSDADIKAEYDRFASQAGGKEYKARHILVDKEKDARDIIAKIKKGAKFEDMAKKMSKDKGSAVDGGNLDWVNPGSLVKEFSDAMVGLKKGQMTPAPVKSQFGFHIIRLDDERSQQMPTLEEVKPQIEQRLTQQRLESFRNELRKKAKVE
jgi:peptidyl-prolyl cis-trans isomerase C